MHEVCTFGFYWVVTVNNDILHFINQALRLWEDMSHVAILSINLEVLH